MKNHFKQRLPGWADYPPIEFDFDGIAELLNHPVVAKYSSPNSAGWGSFLRLSISPPSSSGGKATLMAEFNDGHLWYCVGYLDHVKDILLPLWFVPDEVLKSQQDEREARNKKLVEDANKQKASELDKAIALLLRCGYGVFRDQILLTKEGDNFLLEKEAMLPLLEYRYEHLSLEDALKCFKQGKINDKQAIE